MAHRSSASGAWPTSSRRWARSKWRSPCYKTPWAGTDEHRAEGGAPSEPKSVLRVSRHCRRPRAASLHVALPSAPGSRLHGQLPGPVEAPGDHRPQACEYGYRRIAMELREAYGRCVLHKAAQRLLQAWDLPLIRTRNRPNQAGSAGRSQRTGTLSLWWLAGRRSARSRFPTPTSPSPCTPTGGGRRTSCPWSITLPSWS